MNEIADRINAMRRAVRDADTPKGRGRAIVLSRVYDAGIEDVWEACTDPERVGRWFLPVTGELKPGGSYQLEGNAGGEILRCEQPRLLRVSWIYGPQQEDGFSEVEVRLTPEGEDRTRFELEHIAIVPAEFWDQFGPGATGVGWDLGLVGLEMFLAQGASFDRAEAQAWSESAEAGELMTASSEAWRLANVAYGESAEVADAMAQATTRFYVPGPDGG
ncbi:SRPBCC family protein [Streptomyces sp. TRM66268-LWL]|uniref:SRPBCC family protein n=1 Tax=Streptomyces polyasparticus TaxID=2767826 RepID=A0ABR7SRY7_9ACTN|nr:SRPBCC family protein [Streptomyces polyasparticus]MBC9717342.1 SRPBCC family protein [Streptomyces polyasparticus]